jgi:MYXO-CTERM domain-containing protein
LRQVRSEARPLTAFQLPFPFPFTNIKDYTMIKASLFAAGLCSVLASTVSADMIAQWDFQTTTNGGTAVAGAPLTPKLFVANFGTGSLYLDGTNGSSNFFEPASGTTNTEINAFGGTTLNATGSMSTVTTSPAALAIVGGAASVPAGTFGANGKAMVFKFSMSGLSNLAVSYAVQRTASGFTTQQWDYSTDGTTWSSAATITGIGASFVGGSTNVAATLGVASGLDNAATAYMRVTFTGATSATGNNRMDNFQFNADAIPAPGAVALIGLAGLVARRRR